MHALRAGLKRIDNKRSKGERGRLTPQELSSDRSDWPIINFQDSNGISPVNDRPDSWEPFPFHDAQQPLSDELSVEMSRSEANSEYNGYDESLEPLTGRSSTYSSTEIPFVGDLKSRFVTNPASWKPLSDNDENAPPIMRQLVHKRTNVPGWEPIIHITESKEQLILESGANPSRPILADKAPFPARNPSRWHPIEHDESTQPLYGTAQYDFHGVSSSEKNDSIDLGSSQSLNNVRKQNDRHAEEKSLGSGRMPPTKSMHTASDIFDPFYVGDDVDATRNQFPDERHVLEKNNTTGMQPFPVENTKKIPTLRPHKGDETMRKYHSTFEKIEPDSIRNQAEHENVPRSNNAGSVNVPDVGSHENYEEEDFSLQQSDCSSSGRSSLRESSTEYFRNLIPVQEGQCDDKMVEPSSTESNNAPDFLSPATPSDALGQGSQRFDGEDNLYKESVGHTQEYWEGLLLQEEDQVSEIEEHSTNNSLISTDRSNIIQRETNVEQTQGQSNYTTFQFHGDARYNADRLVTDHTESTTFEEDHSREGLRFVALLSEFSGTLQQRTEQDRAMSILRGRKIRNIEEVDGSKVGNKDRRNALFQISGQRGKYPQFFLEKGGNIIIYLGDFEWLTYLNEIGSLTNETIFGISGAPQSPNENAEINFGGMVHAKPDRGEDFPQCRENSIKSDMSENRTSRDDYENVEYFHATDERNRAIDLESNQLASNATHYMSSLYHGPTGTTSNDVRPHSGDIEVIDVEAMSSLKNYAENHWKRPVEEPDFSTMNVNSNADFVCNSQSRNDPVKDTEPVQDDEDDSLRSLEQFEEDEQLQDSSIRSSQSHMEELSTDQVQCDRSKSRRKMGRRTLLTSAGSLLDNEPEIDGVLQSTFLSSQLIDSSMKSDYSCTDDRNNPQSQSMYSTSSHGSCSSDDKEYNHLGKQMNTSRVDNGQLKGGAAQSRVHALSIEVGPHRKNEIDRCSSFGKPELPRVGRDEKGLEEKSDETKEGEERRRKRWKRRLLREHRRRQSMNKARAKQKEEPLGSSMDEIEMMNIFLAVAGPGFDGPLSTKEMEELQDRSRRAGLPVEFTNRMLDQNAGILMWERKTEPKIEEEEVSPSTTAFEEKDTEAFPITPPSSIVDESYDEEGFTRKTPKEESSFPCFKNTFLAESSNIVGADMIENIQAALSGDSERKGGWSSTDMIENIKATLSGDGSDRKSFGDKSSGWSSMDMVESIKATLSGDSNDTKKSWRSSNVMESIKAALSGDSESKRKSRTVDETIWSTEATPVETVPAVDIDRFGHKGLHEC